MPDNRSLTVQRFCAEQGADCVYLLTAIQPFTVSQNRCMVVVAGRSARLLCCHSCTPRTSLAQGSMRDVEPETLNRFLRDLEGAALAWEADAVPPNIHDGLTITVERATAGGYERVRMVEPPSGGPHARLLAAWVNAFPEVRRAIG
ncbi:MAG: hypothetical protein M5U29_09040 [Anaerolineae bacterium]|nr:hypothetical protein [Anaerolineae bacterium]